MTGPFGIRLGYQVCPRFSLEPLQGSRTDRILIASAKKKDLVISNRVRQVHDSALISHDSSCSMPFNRPVEVEPKLANRPATVLRTLCVWQLRDTRLGVRHVPLHLAGCTTYLYYCPWQHARICSLQSTCSIPTRINRRQKLAIAYLGETVVMGQAIATTSEQKHGSCLFGSRRSTSS